MTSETLYFHKGLAHVVRPISPPGCEQPWAQVYVPAREEDLIDQHRVQQCLDLSNWPKITASTILLVREYFAQVYELWKTEAIILFHRATGDDAYTLVSPPWYAATSGHVRYDPNILSFCGSCQIGSLELEAGSSCPMCPDGTLLEFYCVGTAHSHGSMDASHSPTDDDNELNQTGFHITFGRLDRGLFAIAPSFVTALPMYRDKDAKGVRHLVQAEELIEIPFSPGDLSITKNWINRVAHPNLTTALTSSGVKPDDLAVVFDIEKLEDLKLKSALVFVGTLPQLELWTSRGAGANYHATSWTQAHAELAKRSKPKQSYGSNTSPGKLGFTHRPGQTPGGSSGTTATLGPKSMTPTRSGAEGTTAGNDPKSFDIYLPFTDLWAMHCMSFAERLELLKTSGHRRQPVSSLWEYCFRLRDAGLADRAMVWALHQLVSRASDIDVIDNQHSGRTPDTLLAYIGSELIEYVLSPLDDVIAEACTTIEEGGLGDLDCVEEALNALNYGYPALSERFDKQAIDRVIASIVKDNLLYAQRYSSTNANGEFVEWLRLLRILLVQMVDNYQSDLQLEARYDDIGTVLDNLDGILLDLPDALSGQAPTPASEARIQREANNNKSQILQLTP